jgi:beta-N-acetylhexosaminidase
MKVPDPRITRRGALLGGTAIIGGIGLGGPARAAGRRPGPGRGHGHRHPPRLSLAQQAGQRVIFSYPGLTPPAELLDRISAGEVGGVIFFGENISGLSQIADVVGQLEDAQAQGPVRAPLLLMTDQEGGKIRRLPGEPALSEKQIGLAADPVAAASNAGTGAGQNLASVGMNVNLAPVLDVFRQAGNFDDQFQRSYSSDPDVAGACGAAFVTAQQPLGVAAAAKHFPGLGAATADQNTDLTVVTLDVPAAELHRVDEWAFRPAIAAGVALVMTSWAVYPALDADRPAGLSRRIVEGELRERLRFRGVTITDALEAGSLAAYGSSAQRGVLAARAGMDVLLCSARDVSQGQTTVAALADAAGRHRLDEREFDAALGRVMSLRQRLG